MSAIRSIDTKPEVYVRKKLHSFGLRYRKYSSKLCGRPDLFFAKYNTAVFVNGCFWHRHEGCKFAYIPKSNINFWMEKFSQTIERDQVVHKELFCQNVKCLIIWECTIKRMMKDPSYENQIILNVLSFLRNGDAYLEI